VRLLLGAIRSLPEPDQDAVLALLLRGTSTSAAWESTIRRRGDRRRVGVALQGLNEIRVGGQFGNEIDLVPADVKVVPIRFPAKLHEQLKGWCERHNFPMAAVVRGLVERFLDSQ
jgi:hypothetical protein